MFSFSVEKNILKEISDKINSWGAEGFGTSTSFEHQWLRLEWLAKYCQSENSCNTDLLLSHLCT